MGNKFCCSKTEESEELKKQQSNTNVINQPYNALNGYAKSRLGSSNSNLQHISEREPEDSPKDPSMNPSAGPLFVSKSRSKADIYCLAPKKHLNNGIVNGLHRRKDSSSKYPLIHRSSSLHENIHNEPKHKMTNDESLVKKSQSTYKIPTSNTDIVQSKHQFTKSALSNQGDHVPHPTLKPLRLKRSSSTSTIFIDDCTVSQPNLKLTVKSLALATFYHTNYPSESFNPDMLKGLGDSCCKEVHDYFTTGKNHHTVLGRNSLVTPSSSFHKHSRNFSSNTNSMIFDEKLHPLNKDLSHSSQDIKEPDFKTIYRFLRNLFSNAQLTAECGVIALVYLERLLTYAELELTPSIWKRVLLGAIILASKVWDDQAVWNVDYCQILKEVPVEDVNELEKEYLEHLQFNINVPSSVYAKYYFELRLLAGNNDMLSRPKPLDMKRARKLDAISRFENDTYVKSTITNFVKRKCLSTECLPQPGKLSRTVLS